MNLTRKLTLLVVSITLIISPVFLGGVYGLDDKHIDKQSDEYFYIFDEDGNIKYIPYDNTVYTEPKAKEYTVVSYQDGEEDVLAKFDSYEDAAKAVELKEEMNTYAYDDSEIQIKADDRLKSGDVLVAKLRGYFEYTEALTGRRGYAHGSSSSDAAYISTLNNGNIRVKFAGVVADVPSANVQLVPFTSKTNVSYYQVSNDGGLYHYYTYNQDSLSSLQVGYRQSYLQPGVKYYSYDGHYFYTDYGTMLHDYRNNTYANSVNASSPYYNYYQYLSFRAKTHFSADDLNRYVTDTKGINTNSKLKNTGADFISAQNTYGANAGLMFGIGINESAWGLSNFALQRNNLFGHNAVDSNPNNATYYNSVLECINTHAYDYISKGYLDGMDWRYRGPHLGDKQSGINVKYASDAYWGEKAASHNYKINNKNNKKDYGTEKIGIINGEHWFYQEPGGQKIYTSGAMGNGRAGNIYDFPVTIIGETTDSSGNKWYKIWSDTTLNDSRTAQDCNRYFNPNRDYVYIKADVVTIVSNGDGGTTTPTTPITPPSIPAPSPVHKGDVNSDGRISSSDYVLVKNHILNINRLSGVAAQAADVNGDGRISSSDYVLIKNHIMGISLIR